MKSLKSGLIVLGSVGLLFLGACGNNNNQEANSSSSPAASSSSSPANSQDKTAAKTETSEKQHGGQVVESGPYHLEFVPEKGANGAHLDLYVLKGDNHEPIPNAKVTAQVQTPDGTQKSVNFTYDAADKHYTAKLPEKAAGQYQVKVTADISGQKADGRFSFNQ
jgi:cytoskeletal protein RodZ